MCCPRCPPTQPRPCNRCTDPFPRSSQPASATRSENPMSFLARFRALTKILAVVMLLSLLAAGITWLGVSALGTLNEGATNMASSAKRALVATRAAQAVLVLNRSEFAVALDPTDKNRAEMKKAIEAQLK